MEFGVSGIMWVIAAESVEVGFKNSPDHVTGLSHSVEAAIVLAHRSG